MLELSDKFGTDKENCAYTGINQTVQELLSRRNQAGASYRLLAKPKQRPEQNGPGLNFSLTSPYHA